MRTRSPGSSSSKASGRCRHGAPIERILERAGRTRRPAAAAHERSGGPYPYPRASAPGDLQETDLVGPRHLRTPHDADGELRLPLARGRISWVRRVAEDGELRIIDHRLRLRRAANEYVVATLATGRDELVARLDGRIIASYRHPISEKVIRPLVGRGG